MSSSLMKWLWMLIIWFLFSLFAFHTCVKQCCDKKETVEAPVVVPPTEVHRYPVDFEWNKAQAYTNDGYTAIHDRLVNEMTDDNKLIITGNYYESEEAPEGFTNMGMARAMAFRDLLSDSIPADRITLRDYKLEDVDSVHQGYFEAKYPEWQDSNDEEVTEIIHTSPDEVTILFPHGSSVKDIDKVVDDLLAQIADRLKGSTERIRIVGHTDNTGNAAANLRLSERRSKTIRNTFRKYGISDDRMDVQWKGQTEPKSTNGTKEGRHNNRRVVLTILK